MSMKEISRRRMYNEDEGMACGPVSITSIDAEIVVEEENGRRVYLHAQWADMGGDMIAYEANTESIYDAYEKMFRAEDDDGIMAASDERDRIENECAIEDDDRFRPFYDELKRMILEEMEARGIRGYFDGEDEEEDEEEEDE